LILVGHELKLMRSELKSSIKKPLTSILIIQVIAMTIAVHIVSAAILYLLFNASPEAGAALISDLASLGLDASRISEIVYYLLLLILVSSFLTGLLSSSFGSLFTRVDESVIISSPTSPHQLFIAKRFKRFLVHVLMVAILIIAVYPLVSRIGFEGFQLLYLYVTILAFIEICGLTENIAYCLSRGAMMARSTTRAAALAASFGALIFFVISLPFLILVRGSSIQPLSNMFPPYLLGQILTSSLSIGNALGASLVTVEAILFLIAASMAARFGLKRWAASPRFVQSRGSFIPLRKNMLVWKAKQKSSFRLIFMKDLWTTIRVPAKFLVPLLITLVIVFFAVQIQEVLPSSLTNPSVLRFADPVFLLSTYLVSVFILPPAWDSFASERRTIFLLKTLPIRPRTIIRGKYCFAVLKSAVYITPIVAAMSILLPHTSAIFLVALEVSLVFIVSNAVGVLASVSYPPTYRGVGPPPLLVILGLPLLSAILTVMIPVLLILSYGDTILFAFWSIAMLFYVLLIVRFCLRKAEESFVKLQEF
jgi:hypothetical protein